MTGAHHLHFLRTDIKSCGLCIIRVVDYQSCGLCIIRVVDYQSSEISETGPKAMSVQKLPSCCV